MRRFVGLYAAMATVAIIAAGAAFAQEADPTGLTSLEPLTQIVDGFAAGDEADGLFLQSETDAGPSGLSQFQVIVNLGSGTSFLDVGVEMIPSGLAADGNLVSLEEQFDGTLSNNLPPLAPFARDGTTLAMDLAPVFEGWTAYGPQGPIEGPIEVREGVTVVAGIELAEPYDPECSETTYVGRAWVGSTVSAPDPLFTTEALTDEYRGTNHSALADRASRLIELVCVPGFGPQLLSFRMKENGGISFFGPFEMFALVKGSHVVLVAPIRVLDEDLTQRFYASPPGGGDVIISEVESQPRLLVPNPYGPDDVRLDLEVVSPPADTDAANAVGNAGETRTLLYHEDTAVIVPLQSRGSCDLVGAVLYLLGFREKDAGQDLFPDDGPDDVVDAVAFNPTSSGSGVAELRDGVLTANIKTSNGEEQDVHVNPDGTGSFETTTVGGGGCSGDLRATTTPDILQGGEDPADAGSGGSTSDDGGGFDLLDLGLFGLLFAAFLAAFGMYHFVIKPRRLFSFGSWPGGALELDDSDEDEEEEEEDDDDDADGPDTGPAAIDDPGEQ